MGAAVGTAHTTGLRILLTNTKIADYSGSGLYVRDVSLALLRRGHAPVVYSPRLGALADELRQAGLPVVSDLRANQARPDLIHGQHHLECMTALAHWPGVPAVYFCHGTLPWEEAPPHHPRILRYVTASEYVQRWLRDDHGIPETRVSLVRNFVDLERFGRRAPLPPGPLRALVFSNQASEENYAGTVRQACAQLGIALDVVGLANGNPTSRPETVLRLYDLVFARGRAALESLAVGAAVVCCDIEGLGEMVTTGNLERSLSRNLRLSILDRPITVELLREQIQRYDPIDAHQVTERVRASAGLEAAVDRIEAIYAAVQRDWSLLDAADLADENEAVARYLHWLSGSVPNRLAASQRESQEKPGEARSMPRGPREQLSASMADQAQDEFEQFHGSKLAVGPAALDDARRDGSGDEAHLARRQQAMAGSMTNEQLLVARDRMAEREKWDRYYAELPLGDEDELTRRFNAEFVSAVATFLKPGSQVLEAGCGGGWQSLALARTHQYAVGLMDFSENALNYARRLFVREQMPAEFLTGDVMTPGAPAFDLVFNAGVLEHYSLEEQAAFLRGMASRSRQYVLALVPNSQCYWYWLWRVRSASAGQWPFGKEVATDDLSAAFAAAGLTVVGRAFLGEDWTESFITSVAEAAPELRDQILDIHRSPLIPPAQKSYLVAWLGTVAEVEPANLPQWTLPSTAEESRLPETLAALSDALALRIGAEGRLLELQAHVGVLERSTNEVHLKLALSDQAKGALERSERELREHLTASQQLAAALDQKLVNTRIAYQDELDQHSRTAAELQARLEAQTKALADGEKAIAKQEQEIARLNGELAKIYSLKSWKLMGPYWRAASALRLAMTGPYLWFRELLRQIVPYDIRRAVVQRVRQEKQSLTRVAPEQERVTYPDACAYDFICFPIIDWKFRYQRPQQLVAQFAQAGHRAFYLRTQFHELNASPLVQPVADGVFGVQLPGPAGLDLYRDHLSQDVTAKALAALDELRLEAGITDAVCLVQLPFWTPLAQAARERWGWKIVYDCLDEHTGFGTMGAALAGDESGLIAQSDLVLATSQQLYAKVSHTARQTLLLPNATDFDHFNRRPAVTPLAELHGPVIGYYGAIAEWFDVDMVRRAAAARPDWNFVLIGHVMGADLAPLRPLANVHLLGEKPYAELPGYLHRFDVACIPFKLNALTIATNPVKFYEYLSAGKPVVAVELPELEPYRQYFYPVKSAADFASQIEAALRESAPGLVEARVAFARLNTWRQRGETLRAKLQPLFGKASVIIVSYNNLDYLRQCLESVFAKTSYPQFEVIVVDNASEPAVAAYLQERARTEPRLKVILNDANLGFARANNLGIEAAGPCDYVVLLNNDVIVTPGWLSKLVGYLGNPQVGLVGPVTNGAGNEARIDVTYQSVADLDRFAGEYAGGKDGLVFDIPMLAMYCVAMRRQLLDQIGNLDERFGIGMFEDDDFSFRVKKAGYRVICATDIYIHHWMRASFKTLEPAQYDELFETNRRRFEAKWEQPWQPHRDRSQSHALVTPSHLGPTDVVWKCNICGTANRSHLADLGRETPSCSGCGSTVRMRAVIHLLSVELFGESLTLPNFPRRPDIRGLGLSDWESYANGLSKKLNYTNTYYHQEPRLDILAIEPALEGSLDFLISSGVFEHVTSPISLAFANARKMLKPTGFMIFSVPYASERPTIEHFPDLHEFTVAAQDGKPVLRNITRDQEEQTYANLVFHGGDGATLEMRLFSRDALLSELAQAGFDSVKIQSEPYFAHGVYWSHDRSLPIVARLE